MLGARTSSSASRRRRSLMRGHSKHSNFHSPRTVRTGTSALPAKCSRTSKQFRLVCGFGFRFSNTDSIDGILQHSGLDMAQRGNLARRLISCFLDYMSDVSLRPVPFDLVIGYSFVEPLPPLMIRFAPVTSAHRFNDVPGIG